ncbi:MAG: hypothetical protein GY859_31215, partial [Desulfobacterales bacterium]|nr:hypothetical protein [Desulfobacterales bacterium]
PVIACHRQYNYVPGLLPFPVVTLQKVETNQARDYVYNYLREKKTPDRQKLARRLVKLLLDDPMHEQVRDLAQTPLFLWMIVERYRQTGDLPQSRGALFETFSKWHLEQLYHEAHSELTETSYPYRDKALLLGALGYELVQRRETSLPEKEVARLVPRQIKNRWRKVLEEIVSSEMLIRDGKKLRFLHQSFQEYFAARCFLQTEAGDPGAVAQKVWQFGWHDTFTVLLGFAGDETEVVSRIIEEALKVNPILTARCLRMAEQPDQRLLHRFVQAQEDVLLNENAGKFAHERAARALAEHGRGKARACLWRILSSPDAPGESRIAVLQRLAEMPGQTRFEPVAGKIRKELLNALP